MTIACQKICRIVLLQPATIVYKNARDFDDAAGDRETESNMWESLARCMRLGRSVKCCKAWRVVSTVNPRINAPGVYSYNRSEPPAFTGDPAFIWDVAFIKSCCIGLLRKNLWTSLLLTETNWFLPERDYVTFRSLLSQFRLLSVCLSSVILVHPTQGVEPFGNISSPLCTLAILWPPSKILRR